MSKQYGDYIVQTEKNSSPSFIKGVIPVLYEHARLALESLNLKEYLIDVEFGFNKRCEAWSEETGESVIYYASSWRVTIPVEINEVKPNGS